MEETKLIRRRDVGWACSRIPAVLFSLNDEPSELAIDEKIWKWLEQVRTVRNEI